ncbi:hypothetical protein JCM8547_004004 [Rhodosporidiobolus lusitaniae]
MDQSLKQQLKKWEAIFRSTHSRNPTKDDIKGEPDIAAKYKEYNKSKVKAASTGASSAKEVKGGKKTAASASSSSSKPPPPPVFKTPTKPKPSRSRPSAVVAQDPSSDALPSITASPSKRLSASKPSTSSSQSSSAALPPPNSATNYILANSPSKLRALAALHSSSGSPNRPQSGGWVGASLAPGLESVKQVDPLRSPQKAKNPFASPRKKKTEEVVEGFGEFERRQKERLKRQRKAKKASAGGGVLGKAAAGKGAGWGNAGGGDCPAQGGFSKTSSIASSSAANGMDLDEVDDFFGSSSQPSQPSQSFVSQLARASQSSQHPPSDPQDDDDLLLGPSPVKPSSSSHSKAPFKPLIVEDGPNPFAPPPPKPKLFETSLRASLPPSAAVSTAGAAANGPGKRGTKRTSSAFFPSVSSSSSGKKARGEEDEEDYNDGDDSFYADALAAADSAAAGPAKKKAPVKRKRVAAVRGKGTGKGKQDEEKEEIDDGVTVSRDEKGGLVLEFGEEEGQEGGEGGKERIVVRSKGMGGTTSMRRAEPKEDDGMDEDEEAAIGDVKAGEGEEDDEELLDDVSLLRPRATVDLLTALRQRQQPFSPSANTGAPHSPSSAAASLPADLASVLSLRASPQKLRSQANAKERQVARLLGEPGARGGGRKKGLLELRDEDEEEEGGEEEEGEGDDDWDAEPDGWKGTGEVMDGYYSDDGW